MRPRSRPPSAVLDGVFFNQLGFQPARTKVATLAVPAASAEEEKSFRVRVDGTGHVVFEGKLSAATVDQASGDTVRQADLSAVKTPGTYRIEVDGATSDRFPVRNDVYANALRLAMRAFYGQRCGCKVDLGNGYKHAACHADGAYHASSGKSGAAPSHGGWHDAGDYGRYVVNSGITCGTLLWAWEMYPDALHGLMLDIPESRKGTPDYLAEVRWNLEWMLSLQDTDGGVFHKQTSDHFCAFIMPEADTLTSDIIGTGTDPYKSTCATADLAAVMAIAARCYKPFDARFAKRCLEAARQAWTWASTNPDVVVFQSRRSGYRRVRRQELRRRAPMGRSRAVADDRRSGVRKGLPDCIADCASRPPPRRASQCRGASGHGDRGSVLGQSALDGLLELRSGGAQRIARGRGGEAADSRSHPSASGQTGGAVASERLWQHDGAPRLWLGIELRRGQPIAAPVAGRQNLIRRSHIRRDRLE